MGSSLGKSIAVYDLGGNVVHRLRLFSIASKLGFGAGGLVLREILHVHVACPKCSGSSEQ